MQSGFGRSGQMDGLEALEAVVGLDAFLQDRLDGRSPARDRSVNLMLDTLGLGLEQSMTFIGRTRPDLATFKAWVLETAGPPDPLRVQRYNALTTASPPPSAVVDWLARIEALAPVLSDNDLEHWDREGYVILRSAISLEEAEAAARFVWQEAGADPRDPETWYGPRNDGIMIQRFQHASLEAARRSERVHKAFAQLWGTVDLWMIIDRVSFNPPITPERPFRTTPLHWDASLIRPIPFATQGILYLTDTPPEQGALQLVPGFHHELDGWLDGLDGINPRNVDLSARTRRIGAGAGDLIIWRQDLPHGASPNTGAQPRLAQYVNMYRADLRRNPVWL